MMDDILEITQLIYQHLLERFPLLYIEIFTISAIT